MCEIGIDCFTVLHEHLVDNARIRRAYVGVATPYVYPVSCLITCDCSIQRRRDYEDRLSTSRASLSIGASDNRNTDIIVLQQGDRHRL